MVRTKQSRASSRVSSGRTVRERKASVSETGESSSSKPKEKRSYCELGASSIPKEEKSNDCGNQEKKIWVRNTDLFAVFGLQFKVSKDYIGRRLYCVITIDDYTASDDIYHGPLITGEEKASSNHDLQLTGPDEVIQASDFVAIVVAIFDLDKPESAVSIPPKAVKGGSFPVRLAFQKDPWDHIFAWTWNGQTLSMKTEDCGFNRAVTVDLFHSDFLDLNDCIFRKCGSLLLSYAAIRDAVAAKVEVMVKSRTGLPHHICGASVTAIFDCYKSTVLLWQEPSHCSCGGGSKSCIDSEKEEISEEHEQLHLLPLNLSRSLVTMPSSASVFTVRVVLWADLGKEEVINGFAKLSVPECSLLAPKRAPEKVISTSESVISCRTRTDTGILVKVTWT